MNIKIYPQEIVDKLEGKLKANSFAYCSTARIVSPSEAEKNLISRTVANSNPNQIDLHYLDAVLVSVGWNKNDDVFDKLQTWASRKTPEDKPFNFEHNEKDIIGHITACRVFDSEGKLISDNSSVNDLPDCYDLVVGSVLYKKWDDENLQARMDKIIAEINEGKWFVSMECLFPDFDYAVITPEGEHKVIARTNDSSFLTKYLRVYGGDGEYQGHKIGRLLKSFVFSGKGLVANPANSRSVILNSDSFTGSYASSNFLGEKVMSTDLVADNKALADEIKSLREQHVKQIAKEVEDYKVKLAASEKAFTDLNLQYDAYKAIVAAKDTQITELTAKATQLEANLVEANKQIEAVRVEKVKAERLSKLTPVVGDEKAKELVTKFASVADDVFGELVAALSTKVNPVEAAKATTFSPETTELSKTVAGSVNTNSTVDRQKAAASWLQSGVLNTKTK